MHRLTIDRLLNTNSRSMKVIVAQKRTILETEKSEFSLKVVEKLIILKSQFNYQLSQKGKPNKAKQ